MIVAEVYRKEKDQHQKQCDQCIPKPLKELRSVISDIRLIFFLVRVKEQFKVSSHKFTFRHKGLASLDDTEGRRYKSDILLMYEVGNLLVEDKVRGHKWSKERIVY